MTQNTPTRKSHCIACGKRLSEKSPSGAIRWQPSHVNDKGIYCETCGAALSSSKDKKNKKS
jgi:hypothetical protein